MRLREASERDGGALVPDGTTSGEPQPRAQARRSEVPRAQVSAGFSMRGFSLLRASVSERLGLVGAVLGLLWLSVYWALQ